MSSFSNQNHHLGGRLVAYIFLAIGIALLVWVFFVAKDMLTHPVPGLMLSKVAATVGGQPATPDFGRMGTAAVSFVLRLLVLLVMTIIASLIASRGIHLYWVTSAPREKANPGASGASAAEDESDNNSTAASSRSARSQ
jgi:hypothetical protein